MTNEHGAINVQADEETALVSSPSADDGSSVSPDIKNQRKRQLSPVVTIISLLAVILFAGGYGSDYSTLDATGAAIGPAPVPFDWMGFGMQIKTYWLEEKV